MDFSLNFKVLAMIFAVCSHLLALLEKIAPGITSYIFSLLAINLASSFPFGLSSLEASFAPSLFSSTAFACLMK